jgi:hypothetical protein
MKLSGNVALLLPMHRESSSLSVFLATLFFPYFDCHGFFSPICYFTNVCEEGGGMKLNRSSVLAEQSWSQDAAQPLL